MQQWRSQQDNFHRDYSDQPIFMRTDCLMSVWPLPAPYFDGQYCSVFFLPTPVTESEIIEPTIEAEERDNFITIFQFLGFLWQFAGSGRVEPKVVGVDLYTYIYPISISFCFPSSCSVSDLSQAVVELVGSYVTANNSIMTITDEQYCFKEHVDPYKFDGPNITVM